MRVTGDIGLVRKPLYAVYDPRRYRLTGEVSDGARMPGAIDIVPRLGQTYVAVANSCGRVVF